MKKNNFVNYLLKLLFLSALFMITITSKINASVKIGRPVKIVSLCFENKNFEDIIQIIDDEGKKEVDIIVLPETWRGQISPETLDGETISTLSKLAKKHNTYILSPIDRKEGKSRLNTAVLIDRKGEIVFTYDKIYPYWSEFDLDPPVDPGTNTNMVYSADFGKIGVAICYDANFPELWQVLRDQGAEIVFWSSAYSAGTQLKAYSLLHHYYIVTSTYSRDCQVYDITGERIFDMSGNNITIAHITLDLDRGIYHENFNLGKLQNLLENHGNEIEKESAMPREQWFVLRSIKPGVSARQLAKEFNMEELVDYQNRSRKEIDKKREFQVRENNLSE
ncbi:MAG TPA: hypothetical protein DC024_10605 [Clostridiales bacterium]|jgi:predicted amidohydrolase|nr:hypothetical protein [Clostridiales bacterium]